MKKCIILFGIRRTKQKTQKTRAPLRIEEQEILIDIIHGLILTHTLYNAIRAEGTTLVA